MWFSSGLLDGRSSTIGFHVNTTAELSPNGTLNDAADSGATIARESILPYIGNFHILN